MRDYLYLWNDPEKKQLVVSGMEFRDIVPELAGTGGVVLLRHRFADAAFDPENRFAFVAADGLAELAVDNVHGYGDFCWADFGQGVVLADLTDQAIAELTFFGQMGRPLRGIEVPGLGNRFLYWAHDDGWYARVFYSDWPVVERLLRRLLWGILSGELASSTLDRLGRGEGAFWCRRDAVFECERSEDIDALQGKHLR